MAAFRSWPGEGPWATAGPVEPSNARAKKPTFGRAGMVAPVIGVRSQRISSDPSRCPRSLLVRRVRHLPVADPRPEAGSPLSSTILHISGAAVQGYSVTGPGETP